MKWILRLLFFTLVVLLIVGIAGIFMPKSYYYQHDIWIDAHHDIAFQQANTIKNWANWWGLFTADSNVRVEYSKKPIGGGSYFKYQSDLDKIGTGKVILTQSEAHNKVVFNIENNNLQKTKGVIELKDTANGCIAKLLIEKENLTYLERYFTSIFYDYLTAFFQTSLQGLKNQAEQAKFGRIGLVVQSFMPEQKMVVITDSNSTSNRNAQLDGLEEQLNWFKKYRKIAFTDSAFKILPLNDTIYTFKYGYPVSKKVWPLRRVKYTTYDSTAVISIPYYGKYNNIKMAHSALKQYLIDKDLEAKGTIWEQYIHTPQNEPDTSRWFTNVMIPIHSKPSLKDVVLEK